MIVVQVGTLVAQACPSAVPPRVCLGAIEGAATVLLATGLVLTSLTPPSLPLVMAFSVIW